MHAMCFPNDNKATRSSCCATACILWALGTFSYFWAHQEGHNSACEYVEVSDQR